MKTRIAKYIFVALLILSVFLYLTSWWVFTYLEINFTTLLFTLSSPTGAGIGSFFSDKTIRNTFLIFLAVVVAIIIVAYLESFASKKYPLRAKSYRRLFLILCGVLSVGLLINSAFMLGIPEYLSRSGSRSNIYKEYYVRPSLSLISAEEDKKNLLYIYLESMESNFADPVHNGIQKDNYIENLVELAEKNTSFSDNNGFGGFHSPAGADHTSAALYATTTGVQSNFEPAIDLSDKEFPVGNIALGDILKTYHYNQEFLCGSDGSFGGRKEFFQTHGDYTVFDYYTAIEKQYISPDYKVWWGFEDQKLYEIAKDELTRLSKEDDPFNFTMLTVDTHFPVGYHCALCGSDYEDDAANIVACADRQVSDFLEWCEQQAWYKDTVIVITGDHPRMDSHLVKSIPDNKRTVYNCIINSALEKPANCHDRIVTTFDIFPTVLAAMGFTFNSNRLGLGTNLYSGEKTIAEEIGYTQLDEELTKLSVLENHTFVGYVPEDEFKWVKQGNGRSKENK